MGVNGVPLGPIPLGDLRELAIAGHIDRRSLVWRDGQPEWRPLGKFPGLARVIDDGASPALPRADAAPASRSNGANGHAAGAPMAPAHVATGFDVPRADAGERPSAWGDLDDEDDDEQPTTVKGRVSVMPTGNALPSQASLPVPPPAALPPGAPNPFGVTSALVPPPAPPPGMSQPPPAPPQAMQLPQLAPPPATPVSIISAIPDSMDDSDEELRPPRRSKWYLIAVAIVFAFALGAIVTHLWRTSSPENTSSPEKTSSDASSSRELSGAAEKRADDTLEMASETARAKSAADRGHGWQPESITASLRPADVERGDELTTARAALASSPSLAFEERAAGAGLDATAIQRTVRRYSPAVRQNCWLRAIEARPPGVPTSVKLTATITVEAGGRVQGVAVSGAPRGYPSLARCVEGAVKSWQFPRSGAQTVTNVPFMFMGQ